jgi:hypothetical protein
VSVKTTSQDLAREGYLGGQTDSYFFLSRTVNRRTLGVAMLQIRPKLLVAALGALASVAVLTLVGAIPQGSSSVNADGTVLNAPYSAERRVTTTDGAINHSQESKSEARDSRGRTYSAGERQWTYLEAGKRVLKSETLYDIDDPVGRTETKWDTNSKIVKVFHMPQKVPGKSTSTAPCQPCIQDPHGDSLEATMIASGAKVEKLGVKTIGGVVAEGTRVSLPNVVHESWYSPELKVLILTTDDDPTGSFRNELVDIVRGEPDVTKYKPPAGYVVQDVQIQLPH